MTVPGGGLQSAQAAGASRQIVARQITNTRDRSLNDSSITSVASLTETSVSSHTRLQVALALTVTPKSSPQYLLCSQRYANPPSPDTVSEHYQTLNIRLRPLD